MTHDDPTSNAIFYGDATVNSSGGMTVPPVARRDIGLEDGGKVLVFGREGHVILTPVPLVDDLFRLALDSAAARAGVAETATLISADDAVTS